MAASVARAAAEAGVGRIVLNTAARIAAPSQAGIFRALAAARDPITSGPVPAVVLEPTVFMENLAAPWSVGGILGGTVAYPAAEDTRISWLSHRALAEAVVAARDPRRGRPDLPHRRPAGAVGRRPGRHARRPSGPARRLCRDPVEGFRDSLNQAMGAPAGDRIAEIYAHLAAHPAALSDGAATWPASASRPRPSRSSSPARAGRPEPGAAGLACPAARLRLRHPTTKRGARPWLPTRPPAGREPKRQGLPRLFRSRRGRAEGHARRHRPRLRAPRLRSAGNLGGRDGGGAGQVPSRCRPPNEGVFAWQDEDKDWLALRYDLTAPLARVAAQFRNDLPSPYRRYAMGPVWRNEKPGPGRFRQFYQCDADTVGTPTVAADAEICACWPMRWKRWASRAATTSCA